MGDEQVGATTVNTWVNVVRRARLGRTTKAVALTLATYADPDGTRVHPGIARLAVDCELTYNVIKASMGRLRRAGLIEVVRQAARRNEADEYRLTLHAELLDRVTVLSPAQVVAAAGELHKRHRGHHRPTRTLQPTAQAADPGPGPDLQPTGWAPPESPAAHGMPDIARPAAHGVADLQPTPLATTHQAPSTTTTHHSDSAVRTAAATPRTRPHQDPEPLWTTQPATDATATTPTAPNRSATPPDAPPAAPPPSDAQTPNPTRNTRQRPAQPARPARTAKPRTRSPRAPTATPPPPPASPTPAAPGDTPRIVWITQDHGPPIAAELVDQHPNRPHIVKIIYCHSRTAAWITRTRITTQEAAA